MKKYFRKTLLIVTALLLALPLLLIAVSCKTLEPRDEVDVIPDSLGTSEGLWLYKGNWRSRTDGTEEEKLLASVTVDEEEYGEEDFKIVSYLYVKETYEIFYIIQIETDLRLCHYNYMTKESSDLYDLPDTESPRDYHIRASDALVYVLNDETRYGVIFSSAAKLLYEDYYGTFDGNIVYRILGEGDEFEYVKDGGKRTVLLGSQYRTTAYKKYGNYVYFFGRTACAVDLETAQCTGLPLFDTSDDMYRGYYDSYYMGGSLYILTYCYPKDNEKEDEYYQFIRVTGASATVAYDLGNAPHGVTMYINGNTIYLVKDTTGRDWQKKYYAYDSKTGKMKRVFARTVKKGKSTEDLQKEEKTKTKELTVGEYTFYVDSIGYDKKSGMFSSYYAKTCYYLMRRHGDTEEFMQYSLNKNNGYFFDDIREF